MVNHHSPLLLSFFTGEVLTAEIFVGKLFTADTFVHSSGFVSCTHVSLGGVMFFSSLATFGQNLR